VAANAGTGGLKLVNPLRERLLAGDLGLALMIRHARTVDIALAASACGFDALYFDLQHSPLPENDVAQMCVAALNVGVTPIVRIPEKDYGMALRVLDAGALGIVVPDVANADEVRAAVDACKYSPLGHRSNAGSLPHFGYRPVNLAEARQVLNDNTLLICMIESQAALDNVEAIAAVPGVDVLHIGSSDLSADLGVPGETTHPKVKAAFERIVAACRKHGKIPGIGGLAGGSTANYEYAIKLGARFMSAANEWALMIAAGKERVQAIRGIRLG
jgi:2-keto-3-deoxy-L-rhamnonate aldolase RhmA